MFNFSNQLIIVTGGTKGIGRAISEAFLKAGGRVIAVYCSDDKTAEEFKSLYPSEKLEVKKLDVSSNQRVKSFFDTLAEKKEEVSVLVNNAGIRRDSILGMMKYEDWQKVIDVNLTGVFNMCKFGVQNMMSQRYGRIINITSAGRKVGFEGQTNYAATKSAVVAFSKSLSREVAKRKITVNCVSPGFIETEMISTLPEEIVRTYKNMIPLKRFGTPEEVSPVVLFLASECTSYVTGSVYDVDGGI